MSGSTGLLRGRAIVIGASIAGLLAARILAGVYRDVVILDRDDLPDGPVARKTVPQEHHAHLLLQRGQGIIERLMPGFMGELAADGALVVDLCADIRCFQGDRWKGRWKTGITAHYSTRTLIEHALRRRVSTIPNVAVRDRTVVKALIFDDSGAVSGVTAARAAESPCSLEADLVIDASGRGSCVSRWLGAAGYPATDTSELVTRLGYVTGVYVPPPGLSRDWTVLLCLPKVPRDRRMAVVSPIEGGRWMVTAGAWFDEQPEPNERAFLEYLEGLPVPDIHAAVSRAALVGKLHRYRMPGGLRRHFERLNRWPRNLLVIGDAVASINPLYSQGMSASALQADALDAGIPALLLGRISFRDLQVAICHAVDRPWALAAAMEQRFLDPDRKPTLRDRIRASYLDHLVAASAQDRGIAVALLKVNNMIAEPDTLFRLKIALRSFAALFRPRYTIGQPKHALPPIPLPTYRF